MAAGKRSGRKSQASNDFLEPLAPINVSASDVGTNRPYDDGAATVSFELPALSPAATSYTVTATAAGKTTRTATGSSSPLTVTGLASATTYTVSVTATNAAGTSQPSSTTTVAVTTVPATPSAPTATSTVADKDNVSWTAPANGGSTITLYYWECDDGKSGNTAGTSIEVTQEGTGSSTNKYRVRAVNANGTSEWSAYSNSVDTVAPFFPFFPPFFPPSFGPFFPPFFPFFPSFNQFFF